MSDGAGNTWMVPFHGSGKLLPINLQYHIKSRTPALLLLSFGSRSSPPHFISVQAQKKKRYPAFFVLCRFELHMDPITKNPEVAIRHIPSEIWFEICSWLPAKSVGRFTAVNKIWYAFIKSSDFIYTHVQRSIARNIGENLLRLELDETCTIFRPNMAGFGFDVVRPDFKFPLEIKSKKPCVVGSFNGVVCLTGAFDSFIYLWNPLLGKFKCINDSSDDHTIFDIGFWYDSAESDYKLIKIMDYEIDDDGQEHSEAEVYSLKNGSWRRIDGTNLPALIVFSDCVFIDRCLNWIIWDYRTSKHRIMSFDTTTEEFRYIELPYECFSGRIDLVLYNGSLGIFIANDLSFWVLKGFGVFEKWFKAYDFDGNRMGICGRHTRHVRNNEIIYKQVDGDQMILYNFEKKQSRPLAFRYSSFSTWVSYNESLVFPD